MAKRIKRITKAQQVLEHIGQFPEGLRFTEIQKFICEMNGLNWDERTYAYNYRTGERDRGVRRYRGYWCDYLTGPSGPYHGGKGLLNRFCIQNPNTKRWILTEKIRGPFAGENMPHTKTSKYNLALSKGYQKLYEESLKSCPHCQRKVHPYPGSPGKEWSPDKTAHMTSWHSGGAYVDCKGRVWYGDQLTTASIKEYEAIRDAVYSKTHSFEEATFVAETWLKNKVAL